MLHALLGWLLRSYDIAADGVSRRLSLALLLLVIGAVLEVLKVLAIGR